MPKQTQPQVHVRLPENMIEDLETLCQRENWTKQQAMIEALKQMLRKEGF